MIWFNKSDWWHVALLLTKHQNIGITPETTMGGDKLSVYPGWVKILVTAIISAACCGGIVAAILISYLTPRHQLVPDNMDPSSMADDAGWL